jgi:hypothetical protein
MYFLDLLWAGAFITETAIKFWGSALDRELYDAARSRDLQQIEAVLVKRILALTQSVSIEEIRAELEQIQSLFSRPHKYRKMHIEALRKVIPPGKAGRDSKITLNEYPELAVLSEELLPAISKLLAVRKLAPKQTTSQTIEFIHREFSQHTTDYLLEHSQYLEEQSKRIPKNTTPKSRARWLADVVAGRRWKLSPSYALKMCKRARALVRKRSLTG